MCHLYDKLDEHLHVRIFEIAISPRRGFIFVCYRLKNAKFARRLQKIAFGTLFGPFFKKVRKTRRF